jgi:HTH-type transcriptional regulator / antitoxin HigA
MDIRPIRTDEDHRAALAEIDACWGATEGTEEGDKLEVLVALVELYEAKRWPIDTGESFDPVDMLRYAIDELGHTQAELGELLGSRSHASEILSRRRPLTVEMIHKIRTFWFAPTSSTEPHKRRCPKTSPVSGFRCDDTAVREGGAR